MRAKRAEYFHLYVYESKLSTLPNVNLLYDLGAKRAERSQNVQWTFCSRLLEWSFAQLNPMSGGHWMEVAAKRKDLNYIY